MERSGKPKKIRLNLYFLKGFYKMAFRNHRFSRLELLVGKQGLGELRNKHVLIVGIGGVGSFAAEALARSAVGKITLVDHDEVCATNVNRQIHALSDTVGQKKVLLMQERIKKINPLAEVFAIQEHHHPEKGDFIFSEAEKLASAPIDCVFDCIDTLVPKVDLLWHCVQKNIFTISSMGSASKWDPSQIKVADISKTKIDPFAKQVRTKLREKGIFEGIKTIYSTEVPIHPEQAVPGTEWQCICPNIQKEFGACVNKRVMLGTTSYLPPMFGLWMASEAIREWLKETDFSQRDTLVPTPTFADLKKAMNLAPV
jgi:tRNA threonylcarbamoyladenosine dehydratase